MTKKLTAQKDFIADICDRLGMEYGELAEIAGINPETMRKYAHGYQKMGDTAGLLLRHIEEEQLQARSRLKVGRADAPIASAYAYMESDTLDQNFKNIASKLPRTAGVERQQLLGNLRAMLDELEVRIAPRKTRPAPKHVSSAPLSAAAKLARRAAGLRG